MSALMTRLAIGLIVALVIMLSLTNARPERLLAELELHAPAASPVVPAPTLVHHQATDGSFTVAIAHDASR